MRAGRSRGRGRLLADLSPLRESPAFRRLWAGSTLSAVGSAMTRFAVPLQVYEMTRSPFAVGLIGVAELVPTVTIGLAGGAMADAVDRRRLVLAATAGSAVVSAGLAAQAFAWSGSAGSGLAGSGLAGSGPGGQDAAGLGSAGLGSAGLGSAGMGSAGMGSIGLLFALVALASAISAINGPTRRTFIRSLLPPGQLTAGLALDRLSFQVVLIAGPALAGLIAAAPGLGLRGCYLLDAASFAGSLYGVARLPQEAAGGAKAGGGKAGDSQTTGAGRPGLRAVAAGVRYIGRSPVLTGAFLADLNATVFGLPVALFPAINAERFGGDPRTLGLFTTAIGVGGLVTAALSGPVGHVIRPGRAMLAAVAVWGAAFAGFALARSLGLTLLMLAMAGGADTFTVVLRGTIVQRVTPEEFRGRVTAADYVVGVSGGQLGSLEAGALGSLTSPVISALSGGLATVAGAVVIGLALPAFARYHDGRETNAGTGPESGAEAGAGG